MELHHRLLLVSVIETQQYMTELYINIVYLSVTSLLRGGGGGGGEDKERKGKSGEALSVLAFVSLPRQHITEHK